MRVFWCRQWEWLACALVGLCLAGSACAAAAGHRAAHYTVEDDSSIEIDFSEADSARVSLPPGEGVAYLAIEEHFVTLEVRVPEADATATLRSVGATPILWVFEREDIGDGDVEITVRSRRALHPGATVSLRRVPAARLGALATEAAISRLPETPSDDEVARAAQTAVMAAAQWREIDATEEAARSLRAAAALFYRADEYAVARRHAQDAVELSETLGDSLAAGLARSDVGLNSVYLSDPDRARSALERARRELAPRYDGVAVNPADSNLCFLAFRTGDYVAAEPCYQGLIELAAATGNDDGIDRYENLLAGVYWNKGDSLKAEAILGRLLGRLADTDRTIARAKLLNNHAVTLRRLGRPQEALSEYQEALDIAREIEDRSHVERVINNLAVVYGDLGAPHRAVDFLAELYALRWDRGDRLAVLAARNYAGALTDAGRPGDALPLLERAIDLARRIDDENGLFWTLQRAAQAKLADGDAGTALRFAREAADLAAEIPSADLLLASALVTLGRAQTAAGEPGAAVKTVRRSLPLWQAVDNPYGEVTARTALAWALRAEGDIAAARAEALAAVRQIERLRTAIVSPDLRASYQSDVSAAYELAVYCEVAAGNTIAALEMTERYRAKTLIDVMLAAETGSNANIPKELLDARAAALAAINQAEDDRLRGRDAPPIGPLLADLDAIDEEIAKADPEAGTRRAPDPIDAAAIRGLHARGEVTLVYFIGRDAGYVWSIDEARIAIETLPSPPGIGEAARLLHAALSRRSPADIAAATLGEMVLAPVRDRLTNAERVAIVGDGALNYVPFDVLTVEGNSRAPLQDKPVAYPPSLTTLALSRALPPSGGRGVAVIADPVFSASDERVAAAPGASAGNGARGGGQTLNRLRLTRLEADAIRKEAGAIDVTVHMDFDARPAALHNNTVTGASIVHIATHGFADDEIPARSGIALSMVDARGQAVTGFVGLRDIFGLDLDADLVVLSACETALGRDLAGEGLLGLTRGFMFAGARRVVASLWRVEDRATARLMGVFYRELFGGASPAEALVAAKAALRADRRFRHPYYWAGFTLQGDWRP